MSEIDAEERAESISWLELFFDLVVVAAVAVFTHGLLGHLTWETLGMTALLYTAVWVSWSLTVLYTNVAGAQTRLNMVMLAMALIAVMTAASPLHEPERANIFVVAFLLLRVWLSRSSMQTGRLLLSWPMLQFGGTTVPWLVSLWVEAPAKYWLWAIALMIDLVLVSARGDDEVSDEALAKLQGRADRSARGEPAPRLVAVEVNRSHLDERLGLFVIIVLGEAVLQVVQSAAEREWSRPFLSVAVATFVLLLGLWRMTFAHGFTGSPHTSLADLPPRAGLPLHLVSTMGLLFLAAGIGDLLAGPDREVPVAVAWLLAAGIAMHFGVGLVAGLAGQPSRRWLLGWAVPTTAFALVIGFVGPSLPAAHVAWLVALPALWRVAAERAPKAQEKRL